MSGLTLRERAEEAVKAAVDFEVNLSDNPSSDDIVKLKELANVAGATAKEWQEMQASLGDIKSANEALAGMGLDVDADVSTDTRDDKLAAHSGIVNPRGMSIGEAFAQSDAYKDFVASNVTSDGQVRIGAGKSATVDFDGVSLGEASAQMRFGDVKNLVTGASDTSGGAFVEPVKFPGVIDSDPTPELTMWDVCTKVPVSTDSFRYIEITSKTNNADFVAEATSSDVLASDLSTGGVTDVAGGLKPESDLAFAERTGVVETIAHWIPITRQAAADAPQVTAIINAFMRSGLDIKIDDGLVNGTGTSPEIRGLLNGTNPYALNAVTGVAAGGHFAALAEAIRVIKASDKSYQPRTVLVNSQDWFSTEFLTKVDGNGLYQFVNALQAPGTFSPWGLRVVVSDAVPVGTQVVGDFRYAIIADRMRAQMYMTDSHRDFFVRNILVILAEQRLGFGVMAPKAFATVSA